MTNLEALAILAFAMERWEITMASPFASLRDRAGRASPRANSSVVSAIRRPSHDADERELWRGYEQWLAEHPALESIE